MVFMTERIMEKKKILIIKGSARKDGYTNRLCDEAEKFFDGQDISVFDTYKESFLPCNGCNYCEKSGKCVNRDLDDFFEKFENSDLIIFASPVYNGTFSAPLKSLIDRFQVYYTSFYANKKTQKIKKRRNAILIVAAGRDGKASFEYMKTQLKFAFSILNIDFSDSVLCANTDTKSSYTETLAQLKRSLENE